MKKLCIAGAVCSIVLLGAAGDGVFKFLTADKLLVDSFIVAKQSELASSGKIVMVVTDEGVPLMSLVGLKGKVRFQIAFDDDGEVVFIYSKNGQIVKIVRPFKE